MSEEETTALTLFRTDEPNAIVERASAQANALAKVIKKQRLAVNIGGREHVRIEGWTLLGTMLGVFPVVVWTRPYMDVGWEARVEARTLAGAIVGAAEAECLRLEDNWQDRPDYALRSMAQTRAVSKAMRLPLGFIMAMAGYEATPAEEMDGVKPSQAPRQAEGAEDLGTCPEHGPLTMGKFGIYCKTKVENNEWCKAWKDWADEWDGPDPLAPATAGETSPPENHLVAASEGQMAGLTALARTFTPPKKFWELEFPEATTDTGVTAAKVGAAKAQEVLDQYIQKAEQG